MRGRECASHHTAVKPGKESREGLSEKEAIEGRQTSGSWFQAGRTGHTEDLRWEHLVTFQERLGRGKHWAGGGRGWRQGRPAGLELKSLLCTLVAVSTGNWVL